MIKPAKIVARIRAVRIGTFMAYSRLYIKERPRRSGWGLATGLTTWLGAGVIVWLAAPNVWLEIIVVGLAAFGGWLAFSWLTGNKRVGLSITVAIVGILVLKRVGWLNGLTGGTLLLISGLISLIN